METTEWQEGTVEMDGERQPAATRRRFGRRLLLGLPLLAGAALATRAQPAEAGGPNDPWLMEGNGNVDANDFLGPINAQALRIRTSNVQRMIVTAVGNVGIGTAAPATRLHVLSGATSIRGETPSVNNVAGVLGLLTAGAPNASAAGVRGEALTNGINGIGVAGRHAGDGIGVLGQSFTGDGVRGTTGGGSGDGGVHGINTGASGYGVWGQADNGAAARGVFGQSTSGIGVYGSGTTHGVYGTVGANGVAGVFGITSTSNAPAVFGDTAASLATGVQGDCSGENGEGVVGTISATTGAANYAVFGSCSTVRGDAGFFSGNVTVTGTLSKGGGAFKIDHPLDPKNKYLLHSFVESPDMKNIYDGVATLDASGAAEVALPDWFDALNRDFRYQLTAIGGAAPSLHIASEVSGNRFRIAGGTAGMKVSWMVTGIRKDAWAEANRIPTELDKAKEERGRLLHPEAFGRDARESVLFEREQRLHSRAQRAVQAAQAAEAASTASED